MKILYGVQGTGNGHITRARVLAKAFEKRDDIQVDFVFSGREPSQYFDMEVFGDYRTFAGLSFVHRNGSVDRFATIRNARPLRLLQDIKHLDASGYDLVLNDFEPISAWAAKRQGVPCISISHQAAFMHPVPRKGDSIGDRLVMKFFAPADVHLGVHWYHFGFPIMPPFIEDQHTGDRCDNHFLVYLPFESLTEIKALLEPLSEHNFVCFHPALKDNSDEGHIKWRMTSKRAFHQYLDTCQGVIANGGFELSSECLQLGKKLLIKPLHGQFEQASNALTLETLGLCCTMQFLDMEEVERWLLLPAGEPVRFPSQPDLLVDWFVSRQWHDTQGICDKLWKQVRFPKSLQQRLGQMAESL